MLRHWSQIFLISIYVSLFVFSSQSVGQDKPLKKIYWGVSTLSPNLWIPWLAKEAKIFEKYGLDVESILLNGSGRTSQALLAGSLFAASVASPQVMLADLNGADLVNVAHGIGVQASRLMVKPEIRKVEDLKGKKIGISSLGSAGDLLFGYVLRKYGIDSTRDVVWLSVGNTAEKLRALYSGSVDAADLSYPADVQAERKGFRALLDAKKEIVYPTASVVTRRKTIKEDRETVMRFVRSYVEGIAFLKANKEFSQKVLGKYLRNNDPEYLDGAYATYKQDFISAPYPITKGLDAIYEIVAYRRADIRSHSPEEFVDTSFVAELDKSGFIKKLYEGGRR
ncbi:MAG TPA: ABC transporter substrate-binding protein [Candidatus Limnocylindrales bacterium]|nr:ABC transporter substrate-binding protein [Candidatus Limnocylindrales bacterium]